MDASFYSQHKHLLPGRPGASALPSLVLLIARTTVLCAKSFDVFDMEAPPPFRALGFEICILRKGSSHRQPRVVLTRAFQRLPAHGPIWLQFGKSHQSGLVPKALATSNFPCWPGHPPDWSRQLQTSHLHGLRKVFAFAAIELPGLYSVPHYAVTRNLAYSWP